MSFDAKALLELLPAIHRVRDAEHAAELGLVRGPLEELLAVFAEQIGVMDENLEQLYDDLFIETCADWVVPYIGDLIGYESLHSVTAKVSSPRAEVAHTIALRRRKGTALVLEQLARDVTGWDARAVEYFQRLGTTQYMNHSRLHNVQAPDLRAGAALEWIGSAFDTTNRTIDVRRIETGRGKHNIPNVGLHLWRIGAYAHRQSPAARAAARRYRVSPLNIDQPLYNRPLAEDDITHLAEPGNVPWPLSRRRLAAELAHHYGERASAGAELDNPSPALSIEIDGVVIERDHVRVYNLSDDAGSWAHTPPPNGIYAVDPVLGRLALPLDAPDPADVRVTYHEGAVADLGGGEYERGATLPLPPATTTVVRVPDDQPTLTAALTALAGDGVVEITDSDRYAETLAISVIAGGSVEIRAQNGRRPVLELAGLEVTGASNSACILNGLLIAGAPLIVPAAGGNSLARFALVHCTLVPGIALAEDASPLQPTAPSLQLELAGLETTLVRCITGGIRSHERASVSATDSVIDATSRERVAFAALDGQGPGAALTLDACTVFGKVHTAEATLISNSILASALGAADTWAAPVRAARKQQGCIRFSFLPLTSIVPARHRCVPDSAESAQRLAPCFRAPHYGSAAYGQLASSTPAEILRGADDEGEMGVLHHLHGPQRETNLRIRLAEYLRIGLSAGVFYES